VTREILSGLIWQARLAFRGGSSRAFSSHGYVDQAYRPPRLPFVSVVGPLSFQTEPERDAGRPSHAPFRIPGHIIGQPRNDTVSIPPGGSLLLRFDGRATFSLSGLPGGSFSNPDTGPALANALNTGLANALSNGLVLGPDGAPLDDAEHLAALASATARWDADGRRLAISSDEGLASLEHRSSVEVLYTPGNIAPQLGLAPPQSSHEGRWFLHRLPAPKPLSVDVRIELWASSQGELAALVDTLALAVTTRGQLLTRPALLAEDIPDGASSLHLLPAGEPTTSESLLHFEASDTHERVRGASLTLSPGATRESAPPRLVFTGSGSARVLVHPTPLIPVPLHANNPTPRGFSLSLGFALGPGGSQGQRLRLLSLGPEAQPVFLLELELFRVGPELFAELQATASLLQGATVATARTHWRVPLASLQGTGVLLHASVDGQSGALQLFLDGESQPLGTPAATPTPPTLAPGIPTASRDMPLVLGNPAGNPLSLTVTSLHLLAEPLGPVDPSLRTSLASASRFRPGDVLTLATSEDGYRAGKQRFTGIVVSSEGDSLTLARPVQGHWPRGRTLVFQDELFFFQTHFRRKDDLLNHLYRCSVDYRVSAQLEVPTAHTSARLVERPEVEVVPLSAGRPAHAAPGVTAIDTGSASGGALHPRGG